MKYRIKIVEYKSGLLEYYPQYKSRFSWHNFIETKLVPKTICMGYRETFKIETDVYRKSLEEAKEFLRNLYPKISYDYNWNQW